ncbi:MAG: transcriptional regulator PpsR [Hyphomicrobium sp.]|nr:transcriptional regulator PpsR [Hyphomicrobium sp.]
MEIRPASRLVEQFRAPKRTLGDLEADAAAKLITAASDVALVIDSKGIIRDVALGSEELVRDGFGDWVGQRWIDTVTSESREKIQEILAEAVSKALPRWRQVNHPTKLGGDVPVRYSAVQIGPSGRVVAVGRDLRAIAALQHRLVDAQQTVEREYGKLRHAETRYRLLFRISSEAVLIVDAQTLRIVEANPTAGRMIGISVKKLANRPFIELFDEDSQQKLDAHLAAVRAVGSAYDVRVQSDDGKIDLVASASMFRQDQSAQFLVRLTPPSTAASGWLASRSDIFDVIQKLPDGFVVVDQDRRIVTANTAFLDLAQIATEEQVRGESLARWVGRHKVDLDVLFKTLREHRSVRNFATTVRGEYGAQEDVDVSAVAIEGEEQSRFGLTVRLASRRIETAGNGTATLHRSVDQLTELVGRVSLKELVRESTDLIERLCIEAALQLTGDNRASAAELLGLSRQGLYSKLRRHGIGDLDGTDED